MVGSGGGKHGLEAAGETVWASNGGSSSGLESNVGQLWCQQPGLEAAGVASAARPGGMLVGPSSITKIQS